MLRGARGRRQGEELAQRQPPVVPCVDVSYHRLRLVLPEVRRQLQQRRHDLGECDPPVPPGGKAFQHLPVVEPRLPVRLCVNKCVCV